MSAGYILARDLGDGELEPYALADGVMPLHQTVSEAVALRTQWGGDPDTWRVYRLVEEDA